MSEGQLNKRGMMDLSIKEMKDLEIPLGDLFSLKGASLNLSWDQAIKIVNYLSGTVILTESSTVGKALESMGNFL